MARGFGSCVAQIELTSPAASEQSRLDCEAICKLGLKSKILTHIRCHMDVRMSSPIYLHHRDQIDNGRPRMLE